MTTRLTSEGRLELPREVLDELGLVAGEKVHFMTRSGCLIVWKEEAGHPFEKWRARGRLPGHGGVDDYLSNLRDGHRG